MKQHRLPATVQFCSLLPSDAPDCFGSSLCTVNHWWVLINSNLINIHAFTDVALHCNLGVTKVHAMGTWGVFPLFKKEGNCSPRRLQCWSAVAYGWVQWSQKLIPQVSTYLNGQHKQTKPLASPKTLPNTQSNFLTGILYFCRLVWCRALWVILHKLVNSCRIWCRNGRGRNSWYHCVRCSKASSGLFRRVKSMS